ncbi:MAG: hypothetical protein ACQSGP_09990, partial [Frankia sp.]
MREPEMPPTSGPPPRDRPPAWPEPVENEAREPLESPNVGDARPVSLLGLKMPGTGGTTDPSVRRPRGRRLPTASRVWAREDAPGPSDQDNQDDQPAAVGPESGAPPHPERSMPGSAPPGSAPPGSAPPG